LICGLALGTVATADAQDAAEAGKITAVDEAFDAALSRKDIAALDAAWAHDASVTAVHPASKTVIVGWEAVRKSWEGAFETFAELAVTLKEPNVRVVHHTAWVVGVETVRGRLASGASVEFAALTTNIYEKRGERWLMVHHQASRAPQ